MRPRPTPPACTDDLLLMLRSARLLDDQALVRLSEAWNGNDPPGPHINELLQAGLLTPFQAELVRAGRARRLRLGPYRLVERLGRAVYKAEHGLLGRLVVLKILGRSRRRASAVRAATVGERTSCPLADGRGLDGKQRTGAPKSRLRQSRREIEAVGQLTHPHLVAAHDACWIRGRLVLVLEYVEGTDLGHFLAQCGPLPANLVWTVAHQTATALDFLHRRRLVHRDVKPANLLLAQALDPSAPPMVKLLDLGLVCPTGTAGEELCGTPDYLPPERGLAADAIDIRGDLYSLGCTLYELLTGRVPFPGGNWQGKLLRHRIEVPTPISELRPETPPALAEIVVRLMARDSDDRPPSPAVVLAMLDAARAKPLIPVAMLAAPPRKLRGKRLAFLAAALLGIILGCLGKWLPSRQGSPLRNTEVATRLGITLVGQAASYPDLATAIKTAANGAIIEVPEGRYRIEPIHLGNKSLTLRAAGGTRPQLRWAGESRRWDALLSGTGDLTLEGLDLVSENEALAPLVLVEGGRLRLSDCRLEQRGLVPAVALRRGRSLEMDRCQVNAWGQALAVEVDGATVAEVRIDGSKIDIRDATAAALLIWSPEFDLAGSASVRIRDSQLQAGRVVACRCVAGSVRLEAIGNRLGFQQALVSFDGYRRTDDWRKILGWKGRKNRYEAAGAWLRLEGQAGPVWSEQAWHRLWPKESIDPSPEGEIIPARDDSSLRTAARR